MSLVTASFETLLEQSHGTAYEYMRYAVRNLDEHFGEGYAKAHPELLTVMIQTASRDFTSVSFAKVLEESLETLAAAISNAAYELRTHREDHL